MTTNGEASVKVLYIGGLGRSGSTLLDRMLGQIPGYFSAGEVRDLWQRGLRENALCGCGIPFRECEVWTQVGKEAFGGWDQIDPAEVQSLGRAVDRHGLIPLILAPRAWPPFRSKLDRYARFLAPLYRAINEVAGSRVVVDSSKAPSTAFLLRRVPGLDLRLIHLVRDSRGVAYSWTKRVVRPDMLNRDAEMHRYPPTRMALRWLSRNGMMELLGRLGHAEIRVTYEELVSAPRVQLERILIGLGEPVLPGALDFISDGQIDLRPNHTVMGNPIRMETGPVRLRIDEQWRTSMDPRQVGMVTFLTRPLLRRYGYRP
jgi:hypothetical protein